MSHVYRRFGNNQLYSGAAYFARTQAASANFDGRAGAVNQGSDFADIGLPSPVGLAV